MKEKSSLVFALGAVLSAVGVVLGAFGAHALEERLAEAGRTAVWETAVLYHLVHAVAIVALGAWAKAGQTGCLQGVAWAWVAGIVLFSGSLYWLSLGGPAFVGPITPLGGLAFIAGWLYLAVLLLRRSD
ncbi:MAG: DUF423 domain-containing protein [Opitutales bacterium]|nr:DUF423 domain-containing protein [Opitutales bacterium]